jgi:hypothetical protein
MAEVTDQFLTSLQTTLQGICDKFKEETGKHMLIGVSMSDDNGMSFETVLTSEELPFDIACIMATGITGMISNGYEPLDEYPLHD